MEVGAVVAAAPVENVVRKSPVPTDSIIIIGEKQVEMVVEEQLVLLKNIMINHFYYVEQRSKKVMHQKKEKYKDYLEIQMLQNLLKNVMTLEQEEFQLLLEN